MKSIWNMVAEKYKKMKKSAKAFVIFMMAMLLLTIFNANIQQLLLPYVKVENPKSGNIFIKVRGNGLLESGETISVSSKEDKQIKDICVEVGDLVKKGEVLAVCENVEDGSLESNQMELRELEDEYEKSLLELSSEYGVEHLVISDAREQLLLAMERLENVKKNQTAYEENAAEIERAKEDLEKFQKNLEAAKTKLGEKQLIDTSELEKTIKQMEEELAKESREQGKETELNEELLRKREQLLKKQEKNAKIQTQIDRVNDLKKSCEEKEKRIQDLQEQQETWMSEGVDVDEAQLDVNQKQIALRQYLLDEKKDNVDFNTLVEKINDKREEIAKQGDEKENKLVADADGVVREILCRQGDVVQRNQTIVEMSPLDTKYKFSFEINKNLIDYVSVGDEAKVLNVWDEDIVCKLEKIKASSEAVDKCVVLEFSADGENLAIGQNLAVSVGETKQYYDLIIPQTALNEDNEGSFVYVLRTQNSGFTVRYYVERVSVQVLGSDEMQVAVSGTLSENDYVVTQSMEPLEDFKKVRLVD